MPPDFGPIRKIFKKKKRKKTILYVADEPRNMNELRSIFKTEAKLRGFAIWDFPSVMGGPGSRKEWRENGLMQSDLVHLTQQGYQVQGELLFQSLMKTLYPDAKP